MRSPFGKDIGWEETAWLGFSQWPACARSSVDRMVRDGEITPERAKKIGHMVLHDNAHQTLWLLKPYAASSHPPRCNRGLHCFFSGASISAN